MRGIFVVILVIVAIILAQNAEAEESSSGQGEIKDKSLSTNTQQGASSNVTSSMPKAPVYPLNANETNELKIGLEPRISDHNFVRDIVERLHALDADIGKLIYNSTSMYAPDDANDIGQDTSKGGEKFTEVLVDLDSLQDEIGVLVNNATRSRQYNILIRLRPLNNILYRIRHNLHLMRNSLVAINTVSSLEKIGNSVIDSTLQAFMRPDANLNEELGDNGNYDINLDKLGDVPMTSTLSTTSTTSTTTTTTPPTTTTTTTTTTTRPLPMRTTTGSRRLANITSTTATLMAPVRGVNVTAIESQHQITTRRARPQMSSQTRRPNQRNSSQRRQTTQKPSTTSIQPRVAE